MTEPILYVDRSDIRPGKLADVRHAMRDLAAFVEAHEPQVIAYRSYLDETESTMTVVAIHPDPASMELHMELGGPKFAAFAAFIRIRSIDVYGRPSPSVLAQLRHKAELLGGATVTVHAFQAGFSRWAPPRNAV